MSAVVDPVTFEHHREALGIGESQPRISWKTRTDEADWRQLGYELQLSSPGGRATLTGRIDSADSVLVPWPDASRPAMRPMPAFAWIDAVEARVTTVAARR